jgi:SAM-dependent methyltransferase
MTGTPGDPGNVREAARRLAVALRDGRCPPDAAFDRFLPAPLRDLSPQHWTPLVVAKRASEWLDSLGIRRVVDIGAGVGKFCVAGALFSRCSFIGLEQRPSRIASARTLARLFGVDDRVSFVYGALGQAPTPVGDAYYFFNPFDDHRCDTDGEETEFRLRIDQHEPAVTIAEKFLRRAPRGTYVLTYNGFGGRVPKSYRLVCIDLAFTGGLRLWRKEHDPRLLPFSRS